MTDISITLLPPAPLYALEIWSNGQAVAARFEDENRFPLPRLGRSAGREDLRLIRFEPTVWLVDGNISKLDEIVGDDGSLTAIGGSVARVRLCGSGWRSLLMEGGVFDAESDGFASGCSAATFIEHVAVRLHVVDDDTCDAYVPSSFSAGLIHFWEEASKTLPVSSSVGSTKTNLNLLI